MILRGTDFGRVWDMSGVRGFFGEGYANHKPLAPFGLTFRGSRLTSKTTTLDTREGNMPLGKDGITPIEFAPKCIKVDLRGGYALNAVSLSGPGLEFLLNTGHWQQMTVPWIFSFMSVAATADDRLAELLEAVWMLYRYLDGFQTEFIFQQNFSCPNVKGLEHKVDETVEEVLESFAIVARILPGLPQVPKLSVTMPPKAAKKIADNKYCDGLCCSNTVRWGELPDQIDWKQFFDKSGKSPLEHLGGGGLSGKPLLPLVIEWIRQVRAEGVYKPIIGGGGILGPKDAIAIRQAGANAIAVGSMSMLRPWRMQKTIDVGNQI
jgi:dihydroorotate dehydrogenase